MRTYESMGFAERAALYHDDRDRYEGLRRSWIARGRPTKEQEGEPVKPGSEVQVVYRDEQGNVYPGGKVAVNRRNVSELLAMATTEAERKAIRNALVASVTP